MAAKETGKKKQYYLNNPNLPTIDAEFEYTPHMIAEIEKCSKHIIHFAENYFHIISVDEGRKKIELYMYQKKALRTIRDNRFTLLLQSRQSGKCLDANTLCKFRNKKTGEIQEFTVEKIFDTSPIEETRSHKMDNKKFIESRKVSDYEIWTDDGWVDVQEVHKTVKFDVWKLKTENFQLECADEHIVIGENRKEIFVKDLKIGDKIVTENGLEDVISVQKLDIEPEHMYDFSIDSDNHTYFSNGILSHNTTISTIYCLWNAIFNSDQRILLVANKESTAKEIFKRIKMAYEGLPNWLKCPVKYYGMESLELINGSSIAISTTTGTAARGMSANLLFVDEADFIECIEYFSVIQLRHKKTGEIKKMQIGDLYKESQNNFNIDEWEILTNNGYKSFKGIIENKDVDSVKLYFNDGSDIICSNDHMFMTSKGKFREAKRCLYKKIKGLTKNRKVINIKDVGKQTLYDVVEVDGHRYITDDLVSHNCNMLMEFWASVYPIISSSKKSKIIMASTPKDNSGLFFKLYDDSCKGRNNWVNMKILWNDVPGRDEAWKLETMSSLSDPALFNREFNCTTSKTPIMILNNGNEESITIGELYDLIEE